MKYRTRNQYTEADKALMWERWRRGESLNAIARLFDRNHSAIGGGGLRLRYTNVAHTIVQWSERRASGYMPLTS